MKNIRRLRMKKKGRICGAIGLMLSLALAGGTVVYGTMFHGNAVGKAEKPFGGASTGNIVDNWINQEGFDKTKKLVDESAPLINGEEIKDAAYSSFSASYSGSTTSAVKDKNTNRVTSVTIQLEGKIYTDKNYTYLKEVERTMSGREAKVSVYEYVYRKEENMAFSRTNTASTPQTEAVNDLLLLDKAEWARISSAGTDAQNVVLLFSNLFTAVREGNECFMNILTGEYYFDLAPLCTKGEKGTCTLTAGTCPTIYYYMETSSKDSPDYYGSSTMALHYSNLNNTEVNIPDSLKDSKAWGGNQQ